MKTSGHTYIFREATRADIPRMKEIRDSVTENALISMKIEASDYEQALFHDGKGWVAEQKGRVVGFACGRKRQKDVWALFIDKEHEGRGIGAHLMDLLEEWMFAQGLKKIDLTTAPGTRAEKLYRRRGWQDQGLTPRGEVHFVLLRSQL